MAWTTEDLAAIEEAIATGALKVKYIDREVTYQSTSDLLKVRAIMRTDLGITNPCNNHRYPTFSKGM